MKNFTTFREDLASGRPLKKPVSSNLLKQRKKENEKAMKTGFMKMPDYVKKTFEEEKEEYKAHWMYKGDKKVWAKKKEDHDRLNKQGYDHDNPETKKVEEEKKNCGCGQDPCITYGKGGKKEMKEQSIFEISDALKKRYIAKAGKDVSGKEHMRDYLQRQMDRSNKKTPGTFSGMNKKFVDDKYDKDTLKRRKGMAKARAGLKEENKPTNPGLWSKAKAAARSKFDVYPSAYANGWAVQWYKKRGGGWKKVAKEEVELQELSPKTISSYQKKAGKQYSDLKKTTPSRQDIENAYHQGYTSDKQYNKQHSDRDKLQQRGKGLAMSKGKGVQKENYEKGRGPTGIAFAIQKGHPDAENPKTRKKYPERQTPEYKANWNKKNKASMTNPPVRSEGAMKRLATDAAEKKRLLKIKTNKPIKTKVTDIGPGGKEYVRKDWSEQKQIVTNLDLDESIANLVKRGVGRVKDTLQQAGQQYVDHQKKQMKAGKGIYSNPVSGDNIRKRMKQMQKKRLTK